MSSLRAGSAMVMAALFVTGCSLNLGKDAPVIGVSSNSGPTPAKASLPATYEGVLSCPGCSQSRTTLNMWPDGVFYLRVTTPAQEGKPSKEISSYDVGRWVVTPDGMKLLLYGSADVPATLAVKSATRLRRLDQDGNEIDPGRTADLVRRPRLEPLEPRLTVDGMYANTGGADRFKECLTDRQFSVSREARYRALVDGYEKQQGEAGEALLATVEGRIREFDDQETGDQHAIVVERFINIWPGESCGRRLEKTELENTYWKLVRLDDQPVKRPTGSPEVHVRLIADGRKVQGFAGCNRLLGGYERDGNRIRFVDLATTRMACSDGTELEERFLHNLSSTASWKIRGNHLELYGADDQALVRLESRPQQ